MVYNEYFSSSSRPDTKVIYQDILPCHDKHSTLPLLLVTKQVSGEVLDILRKREQFVYRVTWWGHGFDDLALSCLRARKMKCDDYAHIPHLRIEVYAPHPDRSRAMINIFSYAKALCKRLSVVDKLHHVSIVFVEDDVALWSRTGVRWVLGSLAILDNMTQATIELPPSLTHDLSPGGLRFQLFSFRLEQSMMGLDSLDPQTRRWAEDIHSANLGYMELSTLSLVGTKFQLISYSRS